MLQIRVKNKYIYQHKTKISTFYCYMVAVKETNSCQTENQTPDSKEIEKNKERNITSASLRVFWKAYKYWKEKIKEGQEESKSSKIKERRKYQKESKIYHYKTACTSAQPTASHSNRDPAELQQPLPEHLVLVMHCTLKPSHRPCYPMLQVAHRVSTPHSTSRSTQGVRSGVQKELEEKNSKI